ncbi:MAG: hypothetical protein KGS60_12000 [Verrucomicrobia bacterium]|nr:hypothetical protein [Verrucomicrobiota bacterium]
MKTFFSIIALAALSTFGLRAEDQKFQGTMACAKCSLGTADSCADTLKVGDVLYHLEEGGEVKTSEHQCSGTAKATVTGKVTERDGKKVITVTSITKD